MLYVSGLSRKLILIHLLLLFSLHAWAAGPAGGAIQGTLFTPGGGPVTSSNVTFKVQVLDKSASCVLYEEVHSGLDLSGTNGDFSFNLGSGSSKVNNVDSSSTLKANIFRNDVNVAASASCPGGVTVAAGDERLIRVLYDVAGGTSYSTLTPDMKALGTPYSVVAETLQGKSPSNFVQIVNDATHVLTQANLENIFSSTNYPKLNSLLNGSASVDFNNQKLINVANPTSAQDAATKNYSDTSFGGKTLDITGVGVGAGDKYVISWDQTAQKWVAGLPNDTTKLPLAGGTMTGPIAMGAQNITNIGHMTMATQRTLGLGAFTDAQETALVATPLATADAGKFWYNSDRSELRIWNGSAAVAAGAGGDFKKDGSVAMTGNFRLGGQWLSNDGGSEGIRVDDSGNVGIGSATPAANLDVGGAMTQTAAGYYFGNRTQMDVAPASASSANGYYGGFNRLTSSSSNITGRNLYGSDSSVHFYGGTGTINYAAGAAGSVGNYTGRTLTYGAGGTFTVAATGGSTIGTAYGVNSSVTNSGSTVTNAYGVYVGSVQGTNKFSVYASDAAAPSYFAGKVGVGTSTPDTGAIADFYGTGAASSVLLPRDTTANRPATGVNGMMRYNSSTDLFEGYAGGAWVSFASTGASSTGQSGTSALTYNSNSDGTGTDGGFSFQSNGSNLLTIANNGDTAIASTTTSSSTSTGALTVAGGLGVAGAINANNVQGLWLTARNGNTSLYSSSSTSAALPVGPNVAIQNVSNTDSTGSYTYYQTSNTNGNSQSAYMGIVSNTGAGVRTPTIVFGQQTGGTAYSERMRIDASGNVGIGTTAPASILHVDGGSVTVGGTVLGSITLKNTAGQNRGILENTGATVNLGSYSGTNFPVTLSTNAIERLRIDSSGNVGIGTASAASLLDLSAASSSTAAVNLRTPTDQPTDLASIGVANRAFFGYDGSRLALSLGTAGSKGIVFDTNGSGSASEKMRITAAGYAGIATSNPDTTLHVYTGNSSGTDLVTIGTSKTNVSANRIMLRQDNIEHYYGPSDGTATTHHGRFKLGSYASGDGVLAGTDSGYLLLRRNSGKWTGIVGGDGLHIVTNGTSTNQTFDANTATEVFTVSQTGNVGIGTSTPNAGAALDVKGAATNSSILVPRDTTANRPATGVNGMMRYNSSVDQFEGYAGGAWVSFASTSGASSGQSSSGALTYNSNSDTTGSDGGFVFQNGGSNVLTINNAGDVNVASTTISTNSTTGALVVSGGLGVANQINAGGTITGTALMASKSDATAYASPGAADTPTGATLTVANSSNTNSAGSFALLRARNSSSLVQNAYIGAISVTGAANYTPAIVIGQQTGASAFTERVRIDSNGNVGIGTTTVNSALDVRGVSGDYLSLGIMRFNSNSGTNDMGIKMGAVAGAGALGYSFIQSLHTGVANDGNLILNPSGVGNVGIGTTTPSTTLSVSGANANGLDIMADTAVPTQSQRLFLSTSTAGQSAALMNVGGYLSFRLGATPGSASGTESFRLLSNGNAYFVNNVGIGTTTPSNTLDVRGGTAIVGQTDAAADLSVTNSVSSATFGWFPSIKLANTLAAQGDGTTTFNRAAFDITAGNGTVTGEVLASYETAGLGNSVYLRTTSSHPLVFGTNSSERMRIDSAGSVGIGTNAPTTGAILDVNGTGATQSSIILPRDTTANRPGTGVAGMIRFNTTLGTIEWYNGSAWTNSPAVTSPTFSTNVSISGTAATTYVSSDASNAMPLAANAGLNMNNVATLDGSGSFIKFGANNTAATSQKALIGAISNTSGNTPSLVFGQQTGASTYAERMRIDASGSVGIGTSSPSASYLLDVNGAMRASSLLAWANNQKTTITPTEVSVYSFTTGTAPSVTLRYSTTSSTVPSGSTLGTLSFAGNNSSWQEYKTAKVEANAEALWTDSSMPTRMTFWTTPSGVTTPSERMRIDASGNVGIGTTNPGATLQVSSTAAWPNPAMLVGSSGSNYSFIGTDTADGADNKAILIIPANSDGGANRGGQIYAFGNEFGSNNAYNGSVVLSSGLGSGTHAERGAIRFKAGAVDSMIIDRSGNVGIGTTTPGALLDLAGNLRVQGNITNWGPYYGYRLDNGSGSFIDISTVANTHTFTTDNTERMRISSTGNVGIGTNNPSFTLDVNGSARATGSVASWSDIRAKKNIVEIPDALNKIQQLRGVTFDWRHEEFPGKKFKEGRDMGVIAQDVEKVFPEAVQTAPDGYKSVAYSELVAPLIQALKQFYAQWFNDSAELHREIDHLKLQNAELMKRLEALEKNQRAPASAH